MEESGLLKSGSVASNGAILMIETSMTEINDFTIGTGNVGGTAAPNGFPGFNGQTVAKYQNYNYMVEIDPRQAVAIRKQYNWGRQGFEGGAVASDNQTVYLGEDGTPGIFSKFVADTPGDFTTGKLFVYKHNAPNPADPWVEVDNTNLQDMIELGGGNPASKAWTEANGTMFNRIEWVAYNPATGRVYFTETGRDNPDRWLDENAAGGVFAPHHIARESIFGAGSIANGNYRDRYGRVMCFDPADGSMRVLLEAGGDGTGATPDNGGDGTSDTRGAGYPNIHLSNPDGLNVMNIGGNPYLIICEDLNGTSHNRTPAGVSNRTCEMFLLDLNIPNPTVADLMRVTTVPLGAEVTGAIGTPDGKYMFVNSQHPSSSNPFPYNHSLTFVISGWEQAVTSIDREGVQVSEGFTVYPNPVAREVKFNKVTDVAIYDAKGDRVAVYRNVNRIDIQKFEAGTYILKTKDEEVTRLVINK